MKGQNTYYEKLQSYSDSSLNLQISDKFEKNSSTISSKTEANIILQPGESIVFATATTTQSNQVVVKGYATSNSVASTNSVLLINNGKEDAYVVNNTTDSYFLRIGGTIDSSVKNFSVGSTDELNYYLGILRPGQIIKVPMTEQGSLSSGDVLVVGETYNSQNLITAGWDSGFIAKMNKYFALDKNAS